MAKVKVAVLGTVGKSIRIDPDATVGAILGTDVFTPEGLTTPAAVRAWLGLLPTGEEEEGATTGIVNHRLLQGLTLGDDHPQYTRKDTLTTLGDLYVRGASAPQRLGVGSVSDVLAIVAGVPAWSQAITPTWTGKHTFSVAPQVAALELGHATDTTLSRVSAGIVAVEGINLTRETRNLTAGAGLTGGGDLSADRTFTVGAGTGITVNADDVALANTAVTPGAYTSADITVDAQGRLTAAASGSGGGGVPTTRNLTAGAGLTGGGDLSADRTFTVGAGTGITVNADDVALANTAVTPGAYTSADITVDAQGRLTAAASGATPNKTAGAHWGSASALVAADSADVIVYFERAATINSVTIVGNEAGSTVIDIWKVARGSLPATVANTIIGGGGTKPTTSSARSSRDTTLTAWTTSVAANDTLTFHVDSISTFKQVSIFLNCQE